MLDIKFIREQRDAVEAGLKAKGVRVDLKYLLELDQKRRAKIEEVNNLRAKHNIASDEIAKLSGKERDGRIATTKDLKANLGNLEFELEALEEEYRALMYTIPNPPLDTVPVGKDEAENVVLREVGSKRRYAFEPQGNVALGEKLDLIDTERAAKVSGSRFGYLKHEAPLLEFALVQFALSFLTSREHIARVLQEEKLSISEKPFIPVVPPVLIRPEAMKAMGYVERGGDEIYFLEKDNLYLVGTSEQSVGPMHMDETFDEGSLPHRHVAFSSCFRREAGSYGKDTRGILRVHQFDKVEMFVLATPETSRDEHELLRALEERMLASLGIPYRVLNICSGDLGDPAAAKYDLEAWLPGQNKGKGEYREVTSTSNTTDFQARRLNTKLRRKDGTTEFVHMLNGTAIAVGRMIIAILENYQQSDGSVKVPDVLLPYMHGITEIRR
jgi:seryl-tRNA synthetase